MYTAVVNNDQQEFTTAQRNILRGGIVYSVTIVFCG